LKDLQVLAGAKVRFRPKEKNIKNQKTKEGRKILFLTDKSDVLSSATYVGYESTKRR